MNENTQDIDLNNDVVNEEEVVIDDITSELEELRAYKAQQEEAKLQAERNREAAKRRLAQKQPTINSNFNQSALKDLEEVKFALRVDNLAEQTGFTKAQIKEVLKKIPNATAELILDPIVATGLREEARKASLQANMPGAGKPATVNGKAFKEMSKEERQANFGKLVQG